MNVWVEAARPRTLTAAVSPVLVGTAAAERFIAWRFVAAALVAVSIQITVNYANDYFDALRGVDTEHRVGPRRVVASGVVTRAQMKRAIFIVLGFAAVIGSALSLLVRPWLIAVGVASFIAALAYSGGPKPYASLGLGELFVFVFFGIVATIGSAYVQDEVVPDVAVAASVPIGLFAVAILMINNIRDIEGDTVAGKRTLAVRLQREPSLQLFNVMLVTAYLATLLVARIDGSAWPLLGLLAAPLLVIAFRNDIRAATPPELIAALVATARLQLIYAVLLAVGLWIS